MSEERSDSTPPGSRIEALLVGLLFAGLAGAGVYLGSLGRLRPVASHHGAEFGI